MTKPNDSGPAFPIAEFYLPNGNLAQVGDPGMSRRDWLAGLAMPIAYGDIARIQGGPPQSMAAVAARAYELADAMIAEGGKEAD